MTDTDLIERATVLAIQGDMPSALYALANSLDARIKIKNLRIREALDQRNLGNNHRAEEILRLAVREAGGGSLLGELYHHLGTNSQGVNQFTKALEYLHLAFRLRADSGDILGAAYTAFQIPMCKNVSGVPYENLLGEFSEAEETIRTALRDADHLPEEHAGNMLQNLAFCLQVKKQWMDALSAYDETMVYRNLAEADKPENERRGVAMTRTRKAECYLALGQIGLARDEADQALLVFERIEDKNRIKQVHDLMAKISEAEKTNSAP